MSVKETAFSSYDGYLAALSELEMDERNIIIESIKAEENGCLDGRRPRFGLSEQSLALVASGLSLAGKRVFVHTPLTPLFVARAYEQIRAYIAIPGLCVSLSSVHDGLVLDQDGAVRQMNEDLALTRVLPNMSVIVPADMQSAFALTKDSANHEGPSYMRLSHFHDEAIYAPGDNDFHVGGGRLLTEGDGVTICACGIMVREALKASLVLAQQGVRAEVIDCYSVKPLPEQMLIASVRRTGCCVVAEKHAGAAGLFGAVSERLSENYSVPVRSVALKDGTGQSGRPEELREWGGLTHREIVHNVIQVWAMRRR